jgi:hypothetical protein
LFARYFYLFKKFHRYITKKIIFVDDIFHKIPRICFSFEGFNERYKNFTDILRRRLDRRH